MDHYGDQHAAHEHERLPDQRVGVRAHRGRIRVRDKLQHGHGPWTRDRDAGEPLRLRQLPHLQHGRPSRRRQPARARPKGARSTREARAREVAASGHRPPQTHSALTFLGER